MPVISTISSGAFVVDGAYAYEQPAAPAIAQGQASQIIVVVGTASDGKPNVPVPFSGASSLFANFGTNTTLPFGLVREALSAMPEATQFIGIRVTDGTELSATSNMTDGQTPTPGTVLTATYQAPGSEANKGTWRADLQSGTPTASPVYRLTFQHPNNNVEVFQNIIGYATVGGPYAAAAFQANALAAVNTGTTQNPPSAKVTLSAGASTIAPSTGVNFAFAGGTDGASGVTSSTIQGQDGATRKGMYAAKGSNFGLLVPAGLTDPTAAGNIAAFAQQMGAIAFIAFPVGTSTSSAISTKLANNINSRFMVACMDWDYVQDAISGTKMLVSPIGKIAGIIASLNPFQSPSNKPANGTPNVIGTEKTVGQPIDPLGEGAQRQANALMYLTNQMPRGGNLFGLPHGLASDGSNISDTRMLNFIVSVVLQIMGQFVGEMQSGQDPDQVRDDCNARLHGFFQSLLKPTRQIAAYSAISDLSNNSLVSIQQGLLRADIAVQTLSPVKFALAATQVGNTVQIQSSTV